MDAVRRRRRAIRPAAAAPGVCLVALVFAFASIAAYAGHTDDGCAVELHCLACHWALASTAEINPPSDPGPPLEVTDRVPATKAVALREVPSPELSSRGPPSL